MNRKTFKRNLYAAFAYTFSSSNRFPEPTTALARMAQKYEFACSAA
ncbi:hypothetical protein [Pontibacter flavimaris]|nr:hypothetical protein [Pontibacter flavimaris]